MSGLAWAMSLPILARTPGWSSQFNRLNFSSLLPPRALLAGVECLYVSRQACSRTTMSRLVSSRSVAVRGGFGATGTRVGFSGGEAGAGRLRDGMAVSPEEEPPASGSADDADADADAGTNEGEDTSSALAN